MKSFLQDLRVHHPEKETHVPLSTGRIFIYQGKPRFFVMYGPGVRVKRIMKENKASVMYPAFLWRIYAAKSCLKEDRL